MRSRLIASAFAIALFGAAPVGCGRVWFDAGEARDAGATPDAGPGGTDAGSGDDGGAETDAGSPDTDAGPPATIVDTTLPTGAVYITGETLTITVTWSEPVTVEGVLVIAMTIGERSAVFAYAGGSGTAVLTFSYVVEPGDVDARGIVTDNAVGGDGSVLTAAGPAHRAIPRLAPGPLINASAVCPVEYAFVLANTDYSTEDFCVAKHEARIVAGVATSTPEGTPDTGVALSAALNACAANGGGHALIANTEWQMVARASEAVPDNWSELGRGSGFMNVGNYSTEIGGSTGNPNRPCETTGFAVRFPGCKEHGLPEFSRRRTHYLGNGEVIWDLGGNVGEWVQGSEPTAPREYVCALDGAVRLALGAFGDYMFGCPIGTAGVQDGRNLGFSEGTGGTNIWRGSTYGWEGTAFDSVIGIFYSNTNPFWSDGAARVGGPGLRCAFHPSMTLRRFQSLEPARTTAAAGGKTQFAMRGGPGPTPMYSFATNASGGTIDPDTGFYTAGPTSGVRDVVRATSTTGTFDAWVDVVRRVGE